MGGSANPGMVQPMGGQAGFGGGNVTNQGFGNFTRGGDNFGAQPMNRTTGFLPPVRPTPQQNPFQQAAAAQTDAMGMARGGANMVGSGANMVNNATGFLNQGANMVNNATNYLGGAANLVGSGANMIGSGSNMIGQGRDVVGNAIGALNPAADRVNQGMTQTAAEGMATYQNPFEDQVVQASMRDIGNQGLQMQNTLGAQAQAAGAFGGSRHGIAEAELAKSTQQQMLDQAARLRQQGFNTALGASQADLGRQLGAAGQSAGIAGQAAGMGGQISGMGSAMGGLGSQLVGAGGQFGNLGSTMGSLGSTMGGFGSAMGGLGSTMGGLGSAASGIGSNLSNMGQTSFGYGNTIADRQARDGAMQQQLMQNLINAGKGQYDNFANAPMNKLTLPLTALGAAPAPESTTTGRQLGIMDYLTAGAQMYAGMPF